jgi:hypothetical protein
MNNSNQNTGKNWPPAVIYITGIVGLAYLLNPTAGIFELLRIISPLSATWTRARRHC